MCSYWVFVSNLHVQFYFYLYAHIFYLVMSFVLIFALPDLPFIFMSFFTDSFFHFSWSAYSVHALSTHCRYYLTTFLLLALIYFNFVILNFAWSFINLSIIISSHHVSSIQEYNFFSVKIHCITNLMYKCACWRK